jgi:hypothetical protein
MKREVAGPAASTTENTDTDPVAGAGKDPVPSSGLGPPVAEFGGRVPIFLLFLVAILVAWPVGTWMPAAGAAAGVLVIGGFLLLVRYPKLKVKVHSEGLVYQTRKKYEVWRWNEVEEFSVLLDKREARTKPSSPLEFLIEKVLEAVVMALLPKAAKYRVSYELRRPGHKLELGSSIRDHKKLGEIAGNLVSNNRLPSLLASVRAGNTVSFGRFVIGPDGVTDTRPKHPRLLPWDAVAGIAVSKYAVAVSQVGQKAHWASARIDTVPNAVILADLVGRVAAEKAKD